MTNSFIGGNVWIIQSSKCKVQNYFIVLSFDIWILSLKNMFAQRLVASFKRSKKRVHRIDIVTEQVRKMLATEDQKLILMVRG